MKKRIVIFGSTKEDVHIGCHALTNGLENLIKKKYSSNEILIQHINLKYLSPVFHKTILSTSAISKKQLFKKIIFRQTSLDLTYNQSTFTWLNAVDQLHEKDFYIKYIIESADVVIINGECIIHHGKLLGRQLLAIGYISEKLNKVVHWVNFSTQNENEDILKIALGKSKHIAVREPYTFDYLAKMNISTIQSFDTAVLAEFKDDFLKTTYSNQNFCLFTLSTLKEYSLKDILSVIKALDLKPFYIPIGQNDIYFLRKIKKLGISYINLNAIQFPNIISFIQQFQLVISGRHHLNLLSIVAGVPFIPLKSNTWKIESVCKLIQYEFEESALLEKAKSTLHNSHKIRENFLEFVPRLRILAEQNIIT